MILSYLFLLLASYRSSAQNPYIQHYTTHDGLPSNTVYYIYQDSKKFIWLATDAGVSRFDGTSFTHYKKKDGLSCNEVIRIKEDSFGRIWFLNLNATMDFFFQNKIYNSRNTPFLDLMVSSVFFHDFYQDQNRMIYFYNHLSEIFALDPENNVKKITIDKKLVQKAAKQDSSIGFSIRLISKASNGGLILWTNFGMMKFNDSLKFLSMITDTIIIDKVFRIGVDTFFISSNKRKFFMFKDELPLQSTQLPFNKPNNLRKITSVIIDKNGFTWVVTFDEGVYCIKDHRFIQHFNIKEGQAIPQDHESNIWISSMKEGIYKISSCLLSHKHYETGLFQQMGLLALSRARGDGIWMTNGKSVFLLLKNIIYRLAFKNESHTFNTILQFNNSLITGQKSFYFAEFKGIRIDETNKQLHYLSVNYSHIQFKRFSINNTFTEVSSHAGYSAFVLNPDDLFDGLKEIPVGERIYNSFYNLQNDLIINAKKNYIYRDGKFSPYKELSHFDNKIITDHLIINDTIELLIIDGDSIFLLCHNKRFNLTYVFESPIDLQIRKIIYKEPTLYISTFRNIYKCENPQNIINHKPVQLRLVDLNFRNIQDILVANDSLYIASDDGLTIIPEASINSITTYIPIPYFQSILVNDKEVGISENKLRLTGNNKIIFDFSCINYSSTPVEYSYRLANIDTTWTTGTVRKVIYQNLPRGDYAFQLRVRKPSSEWSKPVECRIRINAAYWQHPLFFVALFLVLSGIVITGIISRKNVQIRQREIDHQLITLEQKALQSMMNPHFIFNSLGSIQNYLLQKKSGEAGIYLSQFARLIRQNLNAINAASINLEEEIDRLKNYLDLEKMRMDKKFEYHIEVEDNVDADEIQIPSMIIQPFVENAIWHGISSIENTGEITIKFRMQDEKSLVVLIEDNGIGMKRSEAFSPKSDKHFHLGMEMTRKRLELLGKKLSVKTAIEFAETSPGNKNPGTQVKLVVPVST